MTYAFKTGAELLELCGRTGLSMGEVMARREMALAGGSREAVFKDMEGRLSVMEQAAEKGLSGQVRSVGGLIGGEAAKLEARRRTGMALSGDVMAKAVARALAVMEVNGAMGRIVAAPTAGSCGILPGVLLTAGEGLGSSREALVDALFAASAVGFLIARNGSVSGAEGGCQAETGTAAAMAAAAAVALSGGTPESALHASAMTLKNVLGLVCDPIAGLVECPCQKRNALGVANALVSADMSLAGIESLIPFDEVVEAMLKVGRALPEALRETARGGLAATPTGIRIAKQLHGAG